MLSIREALDLMLPSFVPVGREVVPLTAALGRVLAQDLVARHDLPELDNSAMDGYALRADDARRVDVELPVQGESRAGGGAPPALAPGHVMRIFTGAPVPAGADTVVMQENTQALRDPARVVIHALPKRGAHVRQRGSDLRAGDLVLTRGAGLGPGEIGLLAAQDHGSVEVFRRPRVALLTTGDELRELDQPARPGSIVNSNAHALAAAIVSAGGEAHVLATARDELLEITARIREGLGFDLLLCVGGVSVGDYDLVERALIAAGVTPTFHKVAIKPGKPLLFGTFGAVPVLGLPGNPVSALVTFEVFVRPGILRMLGHAAPFPWPIRVELADAYEHSPGRTELARASLSVRGERFVAQLHSRQGSGSLPSLVGVDALVILPADRTSFPAGTGLWALRPSDPPRSTEPPFHD